MVVMLFNFEDAFLVVTLPISDFRQPQPASDNQHVLIHVRCDADRY
jgi:hypothetical protein